MLDDRTAKEANKANEGGVWLDRLQELLRFFRLFRTRIQHEAGNVVSYLKLLRNSKARRRESIRRGEWQQDAPGPRREETGALAAKPVSSADHRRLEEAGYKPKISFGGRVIWERPDTGYWVSQDMALHLLEKNEEVR